MRFGPLPPTFRTIRFRLAAWNALVIVLTALLVILAVREGLHIALLDEMDALLKADFNEIQGFVNDDWNNQEKLLRILNRKAESHIRRPWFVQFVDSERRIILASQGMPEPIDIQTAHARVFPTSIGNFRVDENLVTTPDGRKLTARIESSIDHIARRLAAVDFAGMVTTGILLVVAPMVGFWLAGRATKPMAEMIQSTERIRPEEISDRLPIRGSGDEIDELSLTINDLLDRLASHLRNNREFLANAAHELRSPLAAVHSAVEVSLGAKRSLEEYEELLSDVAERTNSLTSLINQLLLLAEAENERLRMPSEEANLLAIVQKTMEMFEPVAESRKITLTLRKSEPAMVKGDPRRLRQVVINLVDNALKFTPEGGAVELGLSVQENGDEAVLRIRDNGIGIPEDEREHVFDRFYRGRLARQRREGSGLGLSICHSIVTGCGGTIDVESAPGRGSTFVVRLRLARARASVGFSPFREASPVAAS